jgi:phosphomevalonate kinase
MIFPKASTKWGGLAGEDASKSNVQAVKVHVKHSIVKSNQNLNRKWIFNILPADAVPNNEKRATNRNGENNIFFFVSFEAYYGGLAQSRLIL